MTASRLSIRRTFAALEIRDYRWLWLGRLATSGTFQMGNVVQGWLVYHLTGSAFALGWVGAGWSVATLSLGMYGGALADRVDKRRMIFWMRVGMLLSTLAIGLLVGAGAIRVWHIAAASFFSGAFSAFLMPAQQALVSDLVDRDTLMNALSLDALGMGIMGIFGASLAGFFIDSVGPQAVYYFMVALYVLSLYAILRLPHTVPAVRQGHSPWADLVRGARYLRSQSLLVLLLALGVVRVFFVMPYMSLMPAFARDNLGLDASGLGLLQATVGLGGLVASLISGHLGALKRKGNLLMRSSAILGFSLILLVTIRWLPSVFLSLALVGALSNLYMVLSDTLVLTHCDPAYRGRIVSISMMQWGLLPLGTIPAGAIADRVGVPWVVGVQGIIVMIVFALVSWRKPELADMD